MEQLRGAGRVPDARDTVETSFFQECDEDVVRVTGESASSTNLEERTRIVSHGLGKGR